MPVMLKACADGKVTQLRRGLRMFDKKERHVAIEGGPVRECARRSDDIVTGGERVIVFDRMAGAGADMKFAKTVGWNWSIRADEKARSAGELARDLLHYVSVGLAREEIFAPDKIAVVRLSDVDSD